MSNSARAGATALVAGPVLGLISMLVLPTLSDDGHDLVAALSAHHSAMTAGLALQAVSMPVMIAGVVWLASTLRGRSPRLAIIGGVLAVAGGLVILFEDGITATAPSISGALDPGRAASTLDHLHSSVAAGLDPLALLFDLGIVLLGFAAVRAASAPKWLGPALTVVGLAQAVGFGSAAKPLVAASFAAMVVLLSLVVRSLTGAQTSQPAPQAMAVA